MAKKALMVVSFGSSYEAAMAAIENIEETCKNAFPDYDFFRAWTSGVIARKLKKTKGIDVLNPREVLDKLVEEEYEEVLCQPTYIIGGIEVDKLTVILEEYRDRIPVIRTGKPLLTDEEDYETVCRAVMGELPHPLGEKEALVLMGHGSEHHANNTYFMFEDMMRDMGYERTFVGTVEGFPRLDYIIRRLKRNRIEDVILMPLLIVAGIHVREDLAGEEEDSWKSVIDREGFRSSVIMEGLGEIDAIAAHFAEHLRNAEQI